MTFGSLKIVDLGDLTWNKELELMCPDNKLGKAESADCFPSRHGYEQQPGTVHALAPSMAIFDNGSKKGGSPRPGIR